MLTRRFSCHVDLNGDNYCFIALRTRFCPLSLPWGAFEGRVTYAGATLIRMIVGQIRVAAYPPFSRFWGVILTLSWQKQKYVRSSNVGSQVLENVLDRRTLNTGSSDGI